jgi:hypothetical protein
MKELKVCPYSNDEIIKACIKLGEKMGDVKLRPYQTPFAYRIIESLLKADGATVTGLFARQCLSSDTLLPIRNQYGLLPMKISNIVKGFELPFINSKREIAYTTVTDYETSVKPTYRVFLPISHIDATADHRFRMSDGSWKGVGELLAKDELVCSFRTLKDSAEKSVREGESKHELLCYYFSQLLLHKSKLDKFSLKTHSNEIEKLLGVSFYRSMAGYSYPVEMDGSAMVKVISYGMVNPVTTLKYLLMDSQIVMFRNNRKHVPKIVIKASYKFYSDVMKFFFNFYNMTIKEVEDGYEVVGFESLQRLQRFFVGHPFYEELREYCDTYYLRIGYKFNSFGFSYILRTYPGIKRWMKNSALTYCRENGIPCATVLQTLKRCGYSEEDVTLPEYCYAPVQDVLRIGDCEVTDIETADSVFIAGNVESHNSGKTESVSVVCDALMVLLPYMASMYPDDERFKKFKYGILIGIFAPSSDQSKTTFDRMRNRISSDTGRKILAEYGLKFSVNRGDTVSINNGSLTRSQTASKDSNIESKTYHLIILEEAQDIFPFKIRKSILPMLSATNGTCVMVGTANTQINDLHSNIRINKRIQAESGVRNHFEYDWKEVCKYAPDYKKSIKQAIIRMGGEDSDEFRMSYCNEFIFQRGMAFSEEQLSDYSVNNPKGVVRPELGVVRKYSSSNIISVGIDVGKSRDSSVCTAVEIYFDEPIYMENYVAYKKRILNWMEMLGDDYNSQIKNMVDFIRDMGANTVWVDITGKGEPIYDMLHAILGDEVDVNPYTFSLKSKHMLYTNLLHDVNSGRLMVPGNEVTKHKPEFTKFIFQMGTLVKDYTGNYMNCHKPEVKIDGVEPHDDYPDSCALAVFAGKEEALYNVEPSDNPFFTEMKGKNSFLS